MSEVKIPVCPQCARKTIYFRKDGSVRCTACGYDGPPQQQPPKAGEQQ